MTTQMKTLHWLGENDPPESFPPVELALKEPDGLLAAGGDLSPERLLAAYRRGIFRGTRTANPSSGGRPIHAPCSSPPN